jgi:hypothetical protein
MLHRFTGPLVHSASTLRPTHRMGPRKAVRWKMNKRISMLHLCITHLPFSSLSFWTFHRSYATRVIDLVGKLQWEHGGGICLCVYWFNQRGQWHNLTKLWHDSRNSRRLGPTNRWHRKKSMSSKNQLTPPSYSVASNQSLQTKSQTWTLWWKNRCHRNN